MSICHAAAFALCVAIVTPVGLAKAAQQTGPAETVRAGAPPHIEADPEHATPSSVRMLMTVEEVMHGRRPSDHREELGRWFDVSTAALGVRYRTLEANPDPKANDLQN